MHIIIIGMYGVVDLFVVPLPFYLVFSFHMCVNVSFPPNVMSGISQKLSQFWYDDKTAVTLAKEALDGGSRRYTCHSHINDYYYM